MNKKVLLAVVILSLGLFLITLKNFNFSMDIVWKIEEQRREHLYVFTSIARFIHNKGFYVVAAIFDNYLSYYSPSSFFCCSQSPIGLVILIFFYCALFVLLKNNSLSARTALASILIYPLFPALMLWKPSFLLQLPLIILTTGTIIYSLYSKIKKYTNRQ